MSNPNANAAGYRPGHIRTIGQALEALHKLECRDETARRSIHDAFAFAFRAHPEPSGLSIDAAHDLIKDASS